MGAVEDDVTSDEGWWKHSTDKDCPLGKKGFQHNFPSGKKLKIPVIVLQSSQF